MLYSGDEYADDEITSGPGQFDDDMYWINQREADDYRDEHLDAERGEADEPAPSPLPPTEDLFVHAATTLVDLYDRIGDLENRERWIELLNQWEEEQTS